MAGVLGVLGDRVAGGEQAMSMGPRWLERSLASTLQRAQAARLDPREFLDDNNTYGLFERLGDLKDRTDGHKRR